LIVSRGAARAVTALILAAVVAAVVALVATGTDNELWQQFKQPTAPATSNQYHRLLSIAGSHRYQYWHVAMRAFDAHPWKGIGPGTFEFYWAQRDPIAEFVRNAHSLYVETLAELGIVGLALIGGFVVFVLVAGSIRALRAPPPTRLLIATAVAGFAAFAASASFDWVWQMGVIPIVAMLLAAGAVASLREEAAAVIASRRPGTRFVATRLLLAAGFVAALVAIAIPLTSTIAVRSSEAADRAGNYRAALKDALSAQRIEPSAATPRLQRAQVLEQMGDLAGATRAIDEAETREPTNWRIWLVASRLAGKTGQPQLALADYRRARSLNPSSPLFRS
jgi:tetratricopeptide (TPR) repeat protein